MSEVDEMIENKEETVSIKNSVRKSRWLVGLNLYGGGLLFQTFQVSRELPDFGAIFVFIFVPIGYFLSNLLVSGIWKRVHSQKYRMLIGFSFIPLYFLISIALAVFIDKIIF
jgi:hypothetical protein